MQIDDELTGHIGIKPIARADEGGPGAEAEVETVNAQELWKGTLADLKGKMAKATFDQWLAGSQPVDYRDGLLTVHVGPLAKEWLEARLNTIVVESAGNLAGQPVRVQYVTNGDGNHQDDEPEEPEHGIAVKGAYVDYRSEIIKPNKIYPVTHYFRLKWVPLLGETLSWYVIALRQHGYWNQSTGEIRETFKWTYGDASKEIGVSDDSLWRARKRVCRECPTPHPVIEHFVLEEKPVYEDSVKLGKRVRVATIFTVRMDEPLTPIDEAALQARLSTAPKPRDRE